MKVGIAGADAVGSVFTLSLADAVGRGGVQAVLEPEMSDSERQALEHSGDAIRTAVSRLGLRERGRRIAWHTAPNQEIHRKEQL